MILSPVNPLSQLASPELPQFASGLLSAVDEAWGNLSSLAKCSSHKEMCAIAGARIAKELHKKGATTGQDAFESFKSLFERFTPSPTALIEVPLPEAMGQLSIVDESKEKVASRNFNTQFENILKKVQWSPAGKTSTSGSSNAPQKRPVSIVSGVTSARDSKKAKH